MHACKHTGKEAHPVAKKGAVEGVNVVYTLVKWDDWNPLRFFQKKGFKKGKMTSLELEL